MPEKIDLEMKKELAKIGMTASLAVTVFTALYIKNKTVKKIHTGAGVALAGFSLWHHLLYQPDKKKHLLKKNTSNSTATVKPS